MSIVVACRCGQAFEADGWLAGKVVQCPVCRSPIAVPTPVEAPPPAHVPRPRPTSTPESRETMEFMGKIVGGGAVLCVMVLGISTGILCYVKGTNPLDWIEENWGEKKEVVRDPREKIFRPDPAAQTTRNTSPTNDPAVAGVTAVTGPPTAVTTFPTGWGYYEHPGGKFSALLPAAPEYLERTIESAGGNQTFFVLTVTHNGHVYEAAREYRSFKIPPQEVGAAYAPLLKMRVDELPGGQSEGSNQVMVDGRLVCDAVLRGKEGEVQFHKYIRLIVFDDTAFELSCRVPFDKERPEDIKLFLGNYRLQ